MYACVVVGYVCVCVPALVSMRRVGRFVPESPNGRLVYVGLHIYIYMYIYIYIYMRAPLAYANAFCHEHACDKIFSIIEHAAHYVSRMQYPACRTALTNCRSPNRRYIITWVLMLY